MLSLAFLCHPSILFKLPTMFKTKHAREKKRRYGRMRIGEEGGSVFPSLQQWRDDLCLSSNHVPLFFPCPPSSLLSLLPPPLFLSSGGRKGSLFLTPACLLLSPLHLLGSIALSLLSREGILLHDTDLPPLRPTPSPLNPFPPLLRKFKVPNFQRRLILFWRISFKRAR